MKREQLIKETAKLILKSSGLSQNIIVGSTLEGRKITQLEHKEIELGTITNYELRKLYEDRKK